MTQKFVTTTSATWAAAINKSTAIGKPFKLKNVTVHFSSAPTTSQLLTITIDSVLGAAYDTVIYSTNPSVGSQTDISYVPAWDICLAEWDEIVVAFTNTDTRTYGLRIITQGLST